MNKEIILSCGEDCEEMAGFIEAAGLNILPYDEPIKARKGYITFFQDKRSKKEINISFLWQFDKPIQRTEVVGALDSIPIKKFMECLTQKGWIQADDCKRVLVGFINYEKSVCRYFHVCCLRALPKKEKMFFNKWRKKQHSITVEL